MEACLKVMAGISMAAFANIVADKMMMMMATRHNRSQLEPQPQLSYCKSMNKQLFLQRFCSDSHMHPRDEV